MPVGVALFNSKSGKRLTDADLLVRISRSDTTLANLRFDYQLAKPPTAKAEEAPSKAAVVEVELGESWSDYRPKTGQISV